MYDLVIILLQGRMSKKTWEKIHILQQLIPYPQKVKNIHCLIPFKINKYFTLTYRSIS